MKVYVLVQTCRDEAREWRAFVPGVLTSKDEADKWLKHSDYTDRRVDELELNSLASPILSTLAK